jgi:TetR/AcrR family fatty acid metabolism transcriptional regulator
MEMTPHVARIMRQEQTTKEMILKTAEKMFAAKGFALTKISDLSSSVGISDSTVYEHYRNKEDILFTIPREATHRLIQINDQHLGGLLGAEIKLRKLIWNYLEFMSSNEYYTTLFLFELRANRTFYETRNFELIKTFTKVYRDVIVEGQKEGEFNPTLSPSLVLKMIFGAIEHILITWLSQNNPKSPTECFEAMIDLLFHSIKDERKGSSNEDKRKQILNAAAQVFSKMGRHKARIQDIARLAGVGDGTIYQYFRNKEEILFTLPIENTKELIGIQQEHLNGIRDTDLKLSFLIKDYLQYCESHKEYSSIVLFDLRYNRSFYQTEGYRLFRDFARIFYDTIVAGKEQGNYRRAADPYLAVKLIFGLIDHSILSWIIFGRPQKIINLSDPICDLVLSALRE